MAFDYKAAMAQAELDAKSVALEAIILGASGSGKSTLLGTLGVKTLYLYASGENHGVKAARMMGAANVVPICFDANTTPDEALENIHSILRDVEFVKSQQFKAVVVDGASEIETLVRASKAWQKMCLTNKGTHNSFEEPKATIAGFRPIITALKDLQRATGVHFAVTCILDVRDLGPNGEIVDASPRLQGFSVAESLVQQFGDVLVVGKMSKNKEVKYKLQFATDLTKTAKEENGTVKRLLNFSPRITGVSKLQPFMDASLTDVINLKAKGTAA